MNQKFITKIIKQQGLTLKKVAEKLDAHPIALGRRINKGTMCLKSICKVMDAAGLDTEFLMTEDISEQAMNLLKTKWTREGKTQDKRTGALEDLKKEGIKYKQMAEIVNSDRMRIYSAVHQTDNCSLEMMKQIAEGTGRYLVMRTRPKGTEDNDIRVELLS